MIGPSGAQHLADLAYAEEMGYDCGLNGPNETNCHFAIFSSPEFTRAWDRGKAKASPHAAPGASSELRKLEGR